jgi:hypothetical protein
MQNKQQEFLRQLHAFAREQQELAMHPLLPGWIGPISDFFARHTFIGVLIGSFVTSIVLMIWQFPQFFELARKIGGV